MTKSNCQCNVLRCLGCGSDYYPKHEIAEDHGRIISEILSLPLNDAELTDALICIVRGIYKNPFKRAAP